MGSPDGKGGGSRGQRNPRMRRGRDCRAFLEVSTAVVRRSAWRPGHTAGFTISEPTVRVSVFEQVKKFVSPSRPRYPGGLAAGSWGERTFQDPCQASLPPTFSAVRAALSRRSHHTEGRTALEEAFRVVVRTGVERRQPAACGPTAVAMAVPKLFPGLRTLYDTFPFHAEF